MEPTGHRSGGWIGFKIEAIFQFEESVFRPLSCHVVCGSDLTRRIIRDGITIMLDVLVPVSWVGLAVVLVITVVKELDMC